MSTQILCVDDEPNILQAFRRQFHHRFDLQIAEGAEKGLEKLSTTGPFAVVVSDLRMPTMDGVEFLRRVREQWPDTVRIMLTGQADLTTAIAAVNQGNIFQFLTKPCPTEILGRALDTALQQHRLVTAERELLEQTLRSAIGVMSEILSLVNPAAFSRAERVRHYVVHIGRELHLDGLWEYELAAMLSQIGCVAVPQKVLEKYFNAQALDAEERELLASQSRIGSELLVRIPRLESVAEIIAAVGSKTDSAGQSPVVATGVKLLRVALEFDELITLGTDPAVALERLRQSGRYSPDFTTALERVEVVRAAWERRLVAVDKLAVGMITNANIYSRTGLLLMASGQEITASALARLQTFAVTVGIREPISVRMPNAVA